MNSPPTRMAQSAHHRWLRIGLRLVVATMIYNVLEACIALWSGVAAGSIALVGFGLDSVIETLAAGLLLWRLRLEMHHTYSNMIEHTEHRVHRFVGGTFLILALYVLGQAVWVLWQRELPQESLLGICLAIASLIIMPLVALGKLRAAKVVGSNALRAEAKETIACSYLSFTLLLGLGANAVANWWWADPVAALCMVPWLVKEGVEGVKGEGCCD